MKIAKIIITLVLVFLGGIFAILITQYKLGTNVAVGIFIILPIIISLINYWYIKTHKQTLKKPKRDMGYKEILIVSTIGIFLTGSGILWLTFLIEEYSFWTGPSLIIVTSLGSVAAGIFISLLPVWNYLPERFRDPWKRKNK